MHANCVAFDGAAVLILGPSGSGKSALSLELMAYGARLVADDQVTLRAHQGQLIANAPRTISGIIESRGFGILNADTIGDVPIRFALDLGQQAIDRVPERQFITILGCDVPLHHRPDGVSLAPVILQYLRSGLSNR